MHFSTLSLLALAASSTTADLIRVAVGQNGLTFTPNNFDADIGDFVEFSFFPKNHTVTQSSFSKPCQPLETTPRSGIFSGFIPTPAPGPSNTTFTIKITDSKPIWLYCGQTIGNHCQSGMVAAINAPMTGFNTFANFVQLASNASTSTSPRNVSGGVLGSAASEQDEEKGDGGKSWTYTASTMTVTEEVEYATTALVVNPADQATIATTVFTAVPTTVTVVSTWAVQQGAVEATGSPDSGNGAGKIVKGGVVGIVGLGAVFALL